MPYNNPRPKLIELVKQHPCIYNSRHKDYNNKGIKAVLWDQIGEKLDLDPQRARELWRTVRDGYIRYKKALKSGKRPGVYLWSEHLAFLDEVLDQKDEDNTLDEAQHVYEVSLESPGQQEAWGESVASSPPQDFNTQGPSTYLYQQTERPYRKREGDTVDKVIDFLRSKKKKEYDAVDLLFMSYAKTFKELPARKQAIVKMTLAKVFAEAEFGDLEQ